MKSSWWWLGWEPAVIQLTAGVNEQSVNIDHNVFFTQKLNQHNVERKKTDKEQEKIREWKGVRQTLKTSTSSKTSSSVCRSSLGRTITFWTVPRSEKHNRKRKKVCELLPDGAEACVIIDRGVLTTGPRPISGPWPPSSGLWRKNLENASGPWCSVATVIYFFHKYFTKC